MPAVAVRGGPELDGIDMLLSAWQAVDRGVFAWFANPVFVLGTLAALSGWLSAAGVLGGLAVLLALTSFAAPSLASTAGAAVPELSWQLGFYCWLSAQLCLMLWSWTAVLMRRSTATR